MAQSLHVTAVVFVYHDKPVVDLARCREPVSVPNGSNAFGQPFQPARVAGKAGPCLPRADQVGVAEVGAAVQDADGRAGAGESGVPRLGEVVRLGVEERELLQLLEVGAGERRRLAVRDLLL